MPKLRVTKAFEHRGDRYEKGKTYVAPEGLARMAEDRGYGEVVDKGAEERNLPKLELEEETPNPETTRGRVLEAGPSGPGDVWEKLKRRAKAERSKPPDWHPEKGDWLLGTVERTGEGTESRFAVVKVAKAPVRARQKLGEDEYREETVAPGNRVLLWEVRT
ncbi:hypothetical protein AKJ45_02110 [candidate division MSBL1 archaeon SCGC-AAA261F19]|uniref:Uncharacterized protein n=2 Tax=candidate division MSBL1 TaxID=215777 RepID=A0A133V9X1_9EURY|nr:hypothetical protein AKJ43_02200 [candidate division MSBL1 archaeon SCGC-AAA261D19]KXB03239.1 hypothetical protein AKJ45_02110 [candidate division MSBL1 archaeon SCGC-AAA261F19]